MKAKKIAALGLSLMMTMSLGGDVLAADIPVQEDAGSCFCRRHCRRNGR